MHISTTYRMFFFSYQITYLGLVGGFDLITPCGECWKALLQLLWHVMNWREVNGKIGVQRLVVKEVVIGETFFRSHFYLYCTLHNSQLFKTALQNIVFLFLLSQYRTKQLFLSLPDHIRGSLKWLLFLFRSFMFCFLKKVIFYILRIILFQSYILKL